MLSISPILSVIWAAIILPRLCFGVWSADVFSARLPPHEDCEPDKDDHQDNARNELAIIHHGVRSVSLASAARSAFAFFSRASAHLVQDTP
jgi:hypothetical protein